MIDLNWTDEDHRRWADEIAELLRDRDAPTGLTIYDYIAASQEVDRLLCKLRFFTDEDGLHLRYRGGKPA